MLTHERLIAVADGLVQVQGVVGVMLGGSRARDDFAPDSDYDLGLYYRPPLGVPDFAYAGEVTLGVVLADPTGELADLKRSTQDYPAALSQALRDRLGEAEFLVVGARKAVSRRDTSYVAGIRCWPT